MGESTWELFPRSDSNHTSTSVSLFSTSLPVLANYNFNGNGLNRELHLDSNKFHDNVDNHDEVESLLPDEDEHLADMVDALVDESDEEDIFGSGGGLEMESDSQENLTFGVSALNITDNGVGNSGARFNLTYNVGPVAGKHPLGEHPFRTLFVRNINSNVEDEEIRALFGQYGDIRALYTACKHRGFVMVSYFDIRAARNARRALQNKPLRRRKLDIHFSIPKENPSDKDINQGTLVAFNVDSSVSNRDLRKIFGAYGEVKEIRETPHKRQHKFIEFYDVRAAEAALKSLNRSNIAGKRIKLEPSRPGGTRRSSLLFPNIDLEQDKWNLHHTGSPIFTSSPLGSSVPGSASVSNRNVGPTSTSRYTERIFANGNSNGGLLGIFEQSRSFPEQNLSSHNGFNFLNHHNYHVGPALSGARLGPTFGYFRESPKGPEASFVAHGYEGLGSSYNGLPAFRAPPAWLSPVFMGNGLFNGLLAGSSLEGDLAGRGSRQSENKKQFELDLDKIKSGADTRTTLMIKNIPNKFTSRMLLDAIDEHSKGTYDFLYLPIDFKNKCNVGYAFINMLSPLHIIPFYEKFNGVKWEKFNSGKVVSLAFARIQGKAALVAHFKNSSLMNQDKRCWPIVFDSESTESDDKIDLREHNLSRTIGSDSTSVPERTPENMARDRHEEL